MSITEPTTVLTDYILALETLAFGILLVRRGNQEHQKPILLWGIAFFAVSLAAVTGGTCHGFVQQLNPFLFSVLWKVTLYSIGISTLCMLSGMTLTALRGIPKKILLGLALLQFIGFVILISRTNNFKYVIHDYVPAMTVILALCIWRMKEPYATWIIGGIVISFAAAGVQLSGFTLHQHFNHNDLYHVIQMVAMYLLYRGGKLLKMKNERSKISAT